MPTRYVPPFSHFPSADSPLVDDDTAAVFAYKKVAKKVHPVAASLPEDFRVIRRRPEDPLLSLPQLPTQPPPFSPGPRLTQERFEELDINKFDFLQPKEVKLAAYVLRVNEKALAWTESERGRFRDDYFSPVKIPTIAHTPWAHKNIPIPTGLLDKVIDILKEKIAAGVYEPSDTSYRSRWFCVPKKNGSLRLVHDLQALNAVTIRNAAAPPFVDQFVEGIAGRSCFSMLDLLVGYDHRTLDISSRDLTSFQSPLGALRNTSLPQGSTNAVAIFHGDVTFILEPEIPHVANPFLDDTVVKGPVSRYESPDGGYDTLPDNPGIRMFIWEHLNDVHRVIHRLGHAGATISAKKIFIAAPEVIVLGHKCTYEGRVPNDSKVAKIRTWPACKTVTDVRAFLGTAGTMRIWVNDFLALAKPLVDLTRKDVDFIWQDEHDQAMESLKQAIIASPALIPIDYRSRRTVFLAVDSSFRGVGWILSQTCEDGQRRPSRFGSIGWNERESRYSQPKVELYGLFRTLRALRMHIIGVTDLVVEMDAQYVRGMLSNPDIQPSAAINRWIAAILLFDFKLVHIPAEKHEGPDGLSRREPIPGEDDAEEWVDDVLALGLWLDTWTERRSGSHVMDTAKVFQTTGRHVSATHDELTFPPPSDKAHALDDKLPEVLDFLKCNRQPNGHPSDELDRLHRLSRNLFIHDDRLWRRNAQGRHQLVLMSPQQRVHVTCEAHDKLGHKGFFSTLRALRDRFWWPSLADDVRWYIQTCHECQIRQTTKVRIPPTVPAPAPLFRKAYVDTMFMPHASGYRYIVQARCSLTAWPEWRALRTETGRTLGAFLFEEILCRWGAVEEIVTDNGTAFVAALGWLEQRFGIRHIRISAYNSRANGIVERQHRTIRESIIKACEGNPSKWPKVAPYAFWADRATTRKSTGHSPFYMAHGVEPVLPFDIALATFLVPNLTDRLSTVDLIATRTRQLQRREDDLAAIRSNVLKSRFESVRQFERQFEKTIRDHNFGPGAFVLVRNSSIETDLGRKAKPRYLGPMVVIRRSQNGAYRLAELDGTVSNLRFAAFRLVPYHSRSRSSIPVTRLVDRDDLARANADEDITRADSDTDDV
jgi:transposase InsO family protein